MLKAATWLQITALTPLHTHTHTHTNTVSTLLVIRSHTEDFCLVRRRFFGLKVVVKS